jgi:hypothetical protein
VARADRPVALELAEQAAKRVEGEIHARILSHAPKLWSLMQAKAKVIVDEVASLPEMPRQLWAVSDVPGEFARFSAHRATYGTLTSCTADFKLCHSVASLVRDSLGYSYNRFPMGAPRSALWLKNWHSELVDDGTFARQPRALRLRYAIAKASSRVCGRPRGCRGQHGCRSLVRRAVEESRHCNRREYLRLRCRLSSPGFAQGGADTET